MIALSVGACAVIVAAAWLLSVLLGPAPASDGPPIAGCVEAPMSELYVQHSYGCPDGTRVVTFADDGARDAYLDAAEHFGAVTVERGRAWARIR